MERDPQFREFCFIKARAGGVYDSFAVEAFGDEAVDVFKGAAIEHISADVRFVFQNAVIEQKHRPPAMRSQIRGCVLILNFEF